MSLEQIGGLLLAIAVFVGMIIYRTLRDRRNERADGSSRGRTSSAKNR